MPDREQAFRFKDCYQALAFYHLKNPARAKYKNLLEAGHGAAPIGEQFSGLHPSDVWASVVAAIQHTVKACDHCERVALHLMHLVPPAWQHHADDVAELLRCTPRAVYNYRRRALDLLETELRRRELMVE